MGEQCMRREKTASEMQRFNLYLSLPPPPSSPSIYQYHVLPDPLCGRFFVGLALFLATSTLSCRISLVNQPVLLAHAKWYHVVNRNTFGISREATVLLYLFLWPSREHCKVLYAVCMYTVSAYSELLLCPDIPASQPRMTMLVGHAWRWQQVYNSLQNWSTGDWMYHCDWIGQIVWHRRN